MAKKQAKANKQVRVGNTTFNTIALIGMDKKQFKELYRGKLNIDIDLAWKEVKKYTK